MTNICFAISLRVLFIFLLHLIHLINITRAQDTPDTLNTLSNFATPPYIFGNFAALRLRITNVMKEGNVG